MSSPQTHEETSSSSNLQPAERGPKIGVSRTEDGSWSSSGSEEPIEEDDGDEEEGGDDSEEGGEGEEVKREEGGGKDEDEGEEFEVVGGEVEAGKKSVEGIGREDDESHGPSEDFEDEEGREVRSNVEAGGGTGVSSRARLECDWQIVVD